MSDRTELPYLSCPICGKGQAVRYRPFCSKRCANVDLNRWLTGGYAIPVAGDDEEAEAGEAGAEDEPGAEAEDEGA